MNKPRPLRLIRTTLRRLSPEQLAHAVGGTRLVVAPPPPPPSESCLACVGAIAATPYRETHGCAPVTTGQDMTRVGC